MPHMVLGRIRVAFGMKSPCEFFGVWKILPFPQMKKNYIRANLLPF